MGACSIRICQFLSFLPLISSPGIGGRASTDRCINTSNNNHSVDYVLMSAYSFLIKLKPSVKSKLFVSLTSPSELTSYLDTAPCEVKGQVELLTVLRSTSSFDVEPVPLFLKLMQAGSDEPFSWCVVRNENASFMQWDMQAKAELLRMRTD